MTIINNKHNDDKNEHNDNYCANNDDVTVISPVFVAIMRIWRTRCLSFDSCDVLMMWLTVLSPAAFFPGNYYFNVKNII